MFHSVTGFINYQCKKPELGKDNMFIDKFNMHTENINLMADIVLLEHQFYIRKQVLPMFSLKFAYKNSQYNDETYYHRNYTSAVRDLHKNLLAVTKSLICIHERILLKAPALNKTIREILLSQFPVYFNIFAYAFYNASFHDFQIDCSKQLVYPESGLCLPFLNIRTSNNLDRHMELLDRVSGQTLTILVKSYIRKNISSKCRGVYDQSHLTDLEKWLKDNVICWLNSIFYKNDVNFGECSSKGSGTIKGFAAKLTYFLWEAYAVNIIEQLFSIIVDFPESINAINDLKICLEKIDMRNLLTHNLTNSLKVRILHPGVNTTDILNGYVAAIKTLRHLDKTGVLLEKIAEPIKKYLRKRTDTVRRVVSGLTEDGSNDLAEELTKVNNIPTKNVYSDSFQNWVDWCPELSSFIGSTSTNKVLATNSSDIISMVVDIYGSKELFMNEYRNLMADRLLTKLDFNTEREIRNIELLKLRFGETLLHSCEVMLKDVTDSKRINTHINNDRAITSMHQFKISSLIISAQYWPSLIKESFELPVEIANEFGRYTKSFEAYKGNRTLNWRHVLGLVNISIQIRNRIFDMMVSPIYAVIIYHFQRKAKWSIEELSALMKVPLSTLRRRLNFWKTHNILQEDSFGNFFLASDEFCKTKTKYIILERHIEDEEEIEMVMTSANEQREEELQVFWSYIVGMLTNLGSLQLERIHQMLKLFASNKLGLSFSQEELKNFLQRKVREHKLTVSGGVYQLVK